MKEHIIFHKFLHKKNLWEKMMIFEENYLKLKFLPKKVKSILSMLAIGINKVSKTEPLLQKS